jgi:capsular exopolysaccharide synthesis family protein
MVDKPGSNDRDGRSIGRDEQPLDLRELLAIFWRRRWLILVVGALVLGGFASRWIRQVPEFRANGRIQVTSEEPAVPGLGLDAPVTRFPTDPVNSEVHVLRSRTLLTAVVDSLNLQLTLGASGWRRSALFPQLQPTGPARYGEYSLAFGDGGVEVRDSLGNPLARAAEGGFLEAAGFGFAAAGRPEGYPDEVRFFVRDRRSASEELYLGVSATALERTNLVDMAYRAYDPELAAAILNTLMELGRRQSIERNRQRASAQREFIQGTLGELEAELRAAEADVQDYQEQVGAISVESEEAGQIANILLFEKQVEDLRLERQLYEPILRGFEADTSVAAESARNGLEALAATPALVKNPAIGELYSLMVSYEVKRDSLISGPSGAGPGNYAVQAVDDQIWTTRTKLVEALREYMLGLDRQVSALRSTIARLRRETEDFLPHAAELERRQQRVDGLRRLYETLVTQLEQTRIEEAAESGRITIIDAALVPRRPTNATELSDIILAVVLAGMLAFGSALVVDYFDDRVRSPREVRRNLGQTVLGVVPRFDPQNGRRGAAADEARVHLEPRSAPAEAYRVIRTNLTFSLAAKPRRTILITSPGAGDGKTTTATNLAAVLAQQGERTLLVDGDLRKASIHRFLGVPQEPGLTGILLGEATVDEAIAPAGIDSLEVLTSGKLPPNPAELAGSERMISLFAELARRYDRIIIDSPPVLAVADPAALTKLVDGAVMVIRAGQTGRQALLEAVERLDGVGVDVLGVVVNALKAEPGYRGRYYYYYYRDGYYGDRKGRGVRNRLRRLLRTGT